MKSSTAQYSLIQFITWSDLGWIFFENVAGYFTNIYKDYAKISCFKLPILLWKSFWMTSNSCFLAPSTLISSHLNWSFHQNRNSFHFCQRSPKKKQLFSVCFHLMDFCCTQATYMKLIYMLYVSSQLKENATFLVAHKGSTRKKLWNLGHSLK